MEIKNLLEKIEDLRVSFYRTLAAFAGLSLVSYFFSGRILHFLQIPLGHPLVFFGPAEAFLAHVKVALYTGIFLCAPFLLYQTWTAFSSLTHSSGRRYTLPIVLSATILFFSGAALCYFLVLPFGLKFLLSFGTGPIHPLISVDKYVNFMAALILIFGFFFQLPLILLALGRVGLVSSKSLSHFRKYAILIIAVVSAVITPTPDAYTMLLLMVPLVFLYELSIILVWFFGRKRKAGP